MNTLDRHKHNNLKKKNLKSKKTFDIFFVAAKNLFRILNAY